MGSIECNIVARLRWLSGPPEGVKREMTCWESAHGPRCQLYCEKQILSRHPLWASAPADTPIIYKSILMQYKDAREDDGTNAQSLDATPWNHTNEDHITKRRTDLWDGSGPHLHTPAGHDTSGNIRSTLVNSPVASSPVSLSNGSCSLSQPLSR